MWIVFSIGQERQNLPYLYFIPCQSGMEEADSSEKEGKAHSAVFNPFQQNENCFYVALGRLLGLDSRTLSLWTGKNELESEKIGVSLTGTFVI